MTPFEAEEFKKKLYELINSCNLTVPTAFYVFKSVYDDFKESYYEQAKIKPQEETEEEFIPEEQEIEIKEKALETIGGENENE